VLSVAAWLCSSAVADAATKKKQSSGQKSKKGKGKGGSMDDSAGQADGDLAPGSDDAKAKVPPAPPPEEKDSKSTDKVAAEPEASSEPPAEPAPEAAAPAEPEPEPEPTSKIRKNWVTLGVQQDFLLFTPVSGVCDATDADGDDYPGHPQYSCRDGDGLYDGNVYSGAGNQIQGGLGVATTRIMIGYDRVFIERLTIGGRIGYAFGGTPIVVGGGTFNPFHAELKSAFFFGDKPFERMSFRPYASLAVGVGEVDGKVSVDFFIDEEGYQQGERGQLDAWRQTGIGFAALGLGVGYPIGPLMPTLELRGLMMVGEPAFAMALAGNIAYGI
jgi:hypothetical protein